MPTVDEILDQYDTRKKPSSPLTVPTSGPVAPEPAAPPPPEPVEANNAGPDVDAILDQFDTSKRPPEVERADINYNLAQDTSPDAAARTKALARKSNLPEDYVARNTPFVANQFEAPKWSEADPAVVSFAAKSKYHAALVKDDHEQLSGVAKAWTEARAAVGHLPAAWEEGQHTVDLGLIGYKQMTGTATKEEIAWADEVEARKSEIPEFDTWLAGGMIGAAKMVPFMANSIAQGQIRGVAAGLTTGTAAGLAGGPLTAAAGFGVGYSAGTASGAADSIYMVESGNAYREYLGIKGANGEAIDPQVAAWAASASGLLITGAEFVGIGALSKTIPGLEKLYGKITKEAVKKAITRPTVQAAIKNVVKDYGIGVLGEMSTEVIQEVFTILGGEVAKDLSPGEFTDITREEFVDRLKETAVETAKAVSVLGAPGGAVKLRSGIKKATEAKGFIEAHDKVRVAGKATKLATRDGGSYQEFLESSALPGLGADAFITGSLAAEHAETLAPILAKVGVTPEAVRAAADAGLDVPVSMAKIHAAGLEDVEWNVLKEALKPGEDGLSALEAKANGISPETIDEAFTLFQEDKANLEELDAALAEVAKRATATGEMTQEQADTFVSTVLRRGVLNLHQGDIAAATAFIREKYRLNEDATPAEGTTLDASAAPTLKVGDLVHEVGGKLASGGAIRIPEEVHQGGADEFLSFALGGELQQATGAPAPYKVGTQKTPLSLGLSEGYTPQDIARFYVERNRPRSIPAERMGDTVEGMRQLEIAREEFYRDLSAEKTKGRVALGAEQRPATEADVARWQAENAPPASETVTPSSETNAGGVALDENGEPTVGVDIFRPALNAPGQSEEITLNQENTPPGINGPENFLRWSKAARLVLDAGIPEDIRILMDSLPNMSLDLDDAREEHRFLYYAMKAFERASNTPGVPERVTLYMNASDDLEVRASRLALESDLHGGVSHDWLIFVREWSTRGDTFEDARALFEQRLQDAASKISKIESDMARIKEGASTVRFKTGEPVVVKTYRGVSQGGRAEGINVSERGSATGVPSATLGDFSAGNLETALSYVGDDYEVAAFGGFSGGHVMDHYSGLKNASADLRQRVWERVLNDLWAESTEDGVVGFALARELFNRDPEAMGAKLQAAAKAIMGQASTVDIKYEGLESYLHTLFVAMQNPYVYDYKGEHYREESYYDVIKRAKEAGHDGAILTNTYDGGPMDNIFVTFDPGQMKETDNLGAWGTTGDNRFLYAGAEQKGKFVGPPQIRGQVTSTTDARYVINLFETSNISTLVHETAHVFLLEIQRMVREGQASNELLQDWAEINRWLKVDAKKGITREQHEQFARGFEAYLRDGKAPSAELKGAFQRFSEWLTAIYKSALELNVNVSPEMRGVFGRLLATQEEIDAFSDEVGVRPLTAREILKAKLSKDGAGLLNRLANGARAEAKKQLQAARDRDRKAQVKTWKEEAKQALAESKIHILRRALAEDGKGLDREALLAAGVDEKDIAAINAKRPATKQVESGGMHPVQAAAEFGYETVAEMVDALKNAPSEDQFKKDYLAQKTAEHDAQFSPENTLLETENLQEWLAVMARAIAKAAGVDVTPKGEVAGKLDLQGRWAKAAEEQAVLRAVERARKEKRDEKAAAKEAARRFRDAAAMTVADREGYKLFAEQFLANALLKDAMRIDRHLQALTRAMNTMRTELSRGNHGEALIALNEARKNQAIIAQVTALREEVRKTQERVKKISKAKGLMAPLFSEAFKDIAYRFGLSKTKAVDPANAPNGQQLVDALSAHLGIDILGFPELNAMLGEAIPSWPFAQTGEFDILRDGTVTQLRDLMTTLKWIEHVGREIQGTNARRYFDGKFTATVVEEMLAEASQVKGKKVIDRFKSELLKKVVGVWRAKKASARILAWALYTMDNFATLDGKMGPHERYLLKIIRDGETEHYDLTKNWAVPLVKAMLDHFGDRMGRNPKAPRAVDIGIPYPVSLNTDPEKGGKWAFKELLGIALHYGTMHSRRAVINGIFDGDIQGAREAMEKIFSAEDWRVIQSIWDQVSAQRAKIIDIFEYATGLKFPVEEASKFTVRTKDGQTLTIRGGYFPLKFDRAIDPAADRQLDIEAGKANASAAAGFKPNAGFTIKRVEDTGSKPPLLDPLRILSSHTEYVARFIAWAGRIKDIQSVVNDPRWQTEAKRVLGPEFLGIASGTESQEKTNLGDMRDLLRELTGAARGENLDWADKLANWTRSRAAVSILIGSNVRSWLTQLLGIAPLATEIGWRNALVKAQFMTRSSYQRFENHKFVMEKSPEMKRRWGERMATLNELIEGGGVFKKTSEAGLYMFSVMDAIILEPAWRLVYEKEMKLHGDEAKAIYAADSLAKKTQPFTNTSERAAALRTRKGVLTLFNMFSSATTQIGNRFDFYRDAVANGRITKGEFVWHVFNERIIPPIFQGLVFASMAGTPGGGDDEKDRADWAYDLGMDILVYQFVGIPFIRDVAASLGSGAKKAYGGLFDVDMKEPPAGVVRTPAANIIKAWDGAVSGIAQMTEDAGSEDNEKRNKALLALAELISISQTGYPVVKIYTDLQKAREQIDEGEAFSIQEPKKPWGPWVGKPAREQR